MKGWALALNSVPHDGRPACAAAVDVMMTRLSPRRVRGRRRERHGEVARVVAKLVNRRLAVTPLKTYAA